MKLTEQYNVLVSGLVLGGGNVDGPILAKLLRKRATLKPSTLRARSNEVIFCYLAKSSHSITFVFLQYKSELVASFTRDVMPHFESKQLQIVIHKVFSSLESIGDAHRMMEENANTGKVVLQVRADEKSEL